MILRKLERNNLCSLGTVSRHEKRERSRNSNPNPKCETGFAFSAGQTRRACYRELRRIPIPRTRVNKPIMSLAPPL